MAERTRAVNEREKGPGVMGVSGQKRGGPRGTLKRQRSDGKERRSNWRQNWRERPSEERARDGARTEDGLSTSEAAEVPAWITDRLTLHHLAW